MNERELIGSVEAADAAEFARILRAAGSEESRVLKTYFGESLFERLLSLAGESAVRGTIKGNVVVLHGMLGGELTLYEQEFLQKRIWISIRRLLFGIFQRLRVAAHASDDRIEATGILKRYYGSQLLDLRNRGWNVRAFWYDWRLDIDSLARRLQDRVAEWFPGQSVHFVAHSMGGLVARSFIRQFPGLWDEMGGRLIMLGAPNHGSFKIPQLLSGMSSILKMVSLLDIKHGLQSSLATVRTFPGVYQMLPEPGVLEGNEKNLWDPGLYSIQPPDLFERASVFWTELAPVADPKRMICVLGANRPTAVGIRDLQRLGTSDGYGYSMAGDGTVPHRFGSLHARDGEPVPSYYADLEHGALPGDPMVCEAVDALLLGDGCGRLRTSPGVSLAEEDSEAVRAEIRAQEIRWEMEAPEVAGELRLLAKDRAALLAEERRAEELLLQDFLSASASTGTIQPDRAGEWRL